MPHARLGFWVEQGSVHWVAGQRLQSQRRNKFDGGRRHDDAHCRAAILQAAHQFCRFVRRDAAGNSEQHLSVGQRSSHAHAQIRLKDTNNRAR